MWGEREMARQGDSDRERGSVTERRVRVEPNIDDSPRQARPSLNIADTGRERGKHQAVVKGHSDREQRVRARSRGETSYGTGAGRGRIRPRGPGRGQKSHGKEDHGSLGDGMPRSSRD